MQPQQFERNKFCSETRLQFGVQMAGGGGRNGCGWFAFPSSCNVVCSYLLCVYYNFYFTTAVLAGNECLQAMVTDATQTVCFTDPQNAINGNSLEC